MKLKYFDQYLVNVLLWVQALQKGTESDARMLVHQSQAGCVIGKGGSKIKELREVSTQHCSVSLHQSLTST